MARNPYRITVFHDGLNEAAEISAQTKRALDIKVEAKKSQWDEKWKEKLEREERRAEREAER